MLMTKPLNYSYKQWGAKKYCSAKCGATSELHNNPFVKGHKHSNSTKKKLSLQKLGNKNPQWKGGSISDGHGYIRYRVSPSKYQLEHRYIMEKKLGRELKRSEHVHHINGVKDDNRIENLIVLNKSAHHSLHKRKHYTCSLNNCNSVHRARGMCVYHYNKWLLERG